MTTAPSYWSLASRAPSAEAPSLAPPRMVFRPERGPASDAGEPTSEAEPTPTVRDAARADVPRLEYGVPAPAALSGPLPPWGGGLGWGVSVTPEKTNPFLEPPTPQRGREQERKLVLPPMQPAPIVRIEPVRDPQSIECEPHESDPRPLLRPPIALAPPPMPAETPERRPAVELMPLSAGRDGPPREEPAERTEVRIGSIVVHLDPPSPRPVLPVPAPVPAKPSGPLARGFTGFGFHQS